MSDKQLQVEREVKLVEAELLKKNEVVKKWIKQADQDEDGEESGASNSSTNKSQLQKEEKPWKRRTYEEMVHLEMQIKLAKHALQKQRTAAKDAQFNLNDVFEDMRSHAEETLTKFLGIEKQARELFGESLSRILEQSRQVESHAFEKLNKARRNTFFSEKRIAIENIDEELGVSDTDSIDS